MQVNEDLGAFYNKALGPKKQILEVPNVIAWSD